MLVGRALLGLGVRWGARTLSRPVHSLWSTTAGGRVAAMQHLTRPQLHALFQFRTATPRGVPTEAADPRVWRRLQALGLVGCRLSGWWHLTEDGRIRMLSETESDRWRSRRSSQCGLRFACKRCGRPIEHPGGLVFSPPDRDGRCQKLHFCTGCWPDVASIFGVRL